MIENTSNGTRDTKLGRPSKLNQFRSSPESEVRLLLLIDGFSRTTKGLRVLEGRVKLAKLDFLLRYPNLLVRVLKARNVTSSASKDILNEQNVAPIDNRMMRYRYGPWDPAYYALLGSLIGRGLIEMLPMASSTGLGYRTTEIGKRVCSDLSADGCFSDMNSRIRILRTHLDLSGAVLKRLLYELPEVADAKWNEDIK